MKHLTSHPSFNDLQTLISSIYDAALEPTQWNNVLTQLAKALKAEQSNMRIIDTKSNDVHLSYCYNKDPHWNELYRDYYIQKDIWLNKILKAKKNYIACTHHHISNKEYEKLEFHSDFVRPQKIHYGMGGKIHIDSNMTGFITLSRDRNNQGFEKNYHRTLLEIIPHLQRSLQISQKFRKVNLQESILTDALNKIKSPIILANNNREILFMNNQAEQITAHHIGILIKNNCLNLTLKNEHNMLCKLILQATKNQNESQQAGALLYEHPSFINPLSILVSPINPDLINANAEFNNNIALITLSQQHNQPHSITLLSDLYNFTQAEARLAVELCLGLTIDEVANKFSLSKNTLKSQLRACFNKTGVSRQVELIRLINEGPAGLLEK